MPHTLAVHGGWGVWSTWGTCSSSCGIGLRRRDRACDSPWPSKDGNPCFGESLAYEICSDYQCKYYFMVFTRKLRTILVNVTQYLKITYFK